MSKLVDFSNDLTTRRFKLSFLLTQKLIENKIVPEVALDYMEEVANLLAGCCGPDGVQRGLKALAEAEAKLIEAAEAA